jgi:hypothetical protein
MDMALHLGMTEAGLRHAMTEQELQRWGWYAERRMLPMRRIELLLAQVSLVVAKAMGGVKDASLEDFLFDPDPVGDESDEDGDALPTADDIAAFFGGVIVKRG